MSPLPKHRGILCRLCVAVNASKISSIVIECEHFGETPQKFGDKTMDGARMPNTARKVLAVEAPAK